MEAYRSALRILAAADCTKSRLIKKLISKGFDEASATLAADRCEGEGYIREAEFAIHTADKLFLQGKGPSLTLEKLKSMEFSESALSCALEYMKGLDYEGSARGYYASEIKKGVPRQRILAALYKRGFDIEQ